MTNVTQLNDHELIAKLTALIAAEKKNVAAQIVLLKEVKRRKLALAMGYPTLMAFCESELGLTKDQAWKRSQAAGAIEKEPELFDMLSKGEASVATLALVAAKLTDKTAAEIKAFVPKKTKREVEAFLSTLRKDGTRTEVPQTVTMTLSVKLKTHDKFKQVARLLRQNKPGLSEDEILDAALEALLEKRDPVRKAARAKARMEKKNILKTAPGQIQKISHKKTRYIPAGVRHAVYSTPTPRCSYRSRSGKRCDATVGLHLDHVQMFCKGGSHTRANLRLLCPGHNRYLAQLALGESRTG